MSAHRRLCLLKWDYVCFCLSQYILGSGQRWPIYGVFRDTQLSHTPSVPLNIGVCGQRCMLTPYLWTFKQKCGGQRRVDFITPYLQLCGRDVWILGSHRTYNCVGAEMCGFWGRTLVNILSQWFVLGAAPVNPPSPVSFNHHIFVIFWKMMMMTRMRKGIIWWWAPINYDNMMTSKVLAEAVSVGGKVAFREALLSINSNNCSFGWLGWGWFSDEDMRKMTSKVLAEAVTVGGLVVFREALLMLSINGNNRAHQYWKYSNEWSLNKHKV